VEELASTSDNLSTEAKELSQTVGRFKVSGIDAVANGKPSLKRTKPVQQMKQAPRVSTYDDFEEF